MSHLNVLLLYMKEDSEKKVLFLACSQSSVNTDSNLI